MPLTKVVQAEKPYFCGKTVRLCKVVLKRYLNGGHPVDMKMAPLFSFSALVFTQSLLLDLTMNLAGVAIVGVGEIQFVRL